MKNTPFKNIIRNAKNISLTTHERDTLFDTLKWYAEANPSVRSPYSFFALKGQFSRPLSYVLAGLIVALLGGSGAVFASQDALPGDALYPIKVHVSEPIKEALAMTSDGKQKARVARVQERLNEAEELAVQNRLASSTSVDLSSVIHTEIDSLKDTLSDDNKNGLEAALSAHGIILESIKKHVSDDVKGRISDIQAAVRDGDNTDDSHADVVVVPAQKKSVEKSAFPEKKDRAERAIKNASQKIQARMKDVSATSPLEREIMDSASSSIQRAQDNLKQAEDIYRDNNDTAAEALIKASEKKAQEASISVDRSLELGKIKNQKKENDGE